MTLDEYRQWGKAEGMLIARREDIVRFLQKLGDIPDSLSARIMSETNMDVLNTMLDVAVSAASIEEFEEKCSNL